MKHVRLTVILFVLAFAAGVCAYENQAGAATAHEIDLKAKMTLDNLYANSPAAKALGEKAVGILVFPSVVKGGFIVGGQYGEGSLLKNGRTVGYYNTVQLSYGLQAGGQKYGYVLFFMSESAMSWLNKSDGWELGVGPSIVVVDIGAAKALTTTTAQSQIYAFFVDQKGLMAGLGLQGTKITKINK
ncbi:MAG: lipid-binding SYLF domain-containing protein [Planctomycetia bacterium]|nr:lipid-binding SYLF domain-containing protein [Candidatus Brocadia sp.]QOJ07674.1 MAG: lipid-binding SYLF domain-containing protein [Planctomycetia bacterium]TVL96648.1 MAG: twin-arginine translocation pathway signal protein [Candidatus Brocadia sp. BL1]HQU32575.1 lipid-binding SYLF domain-containing protein [Candidatus Brocadia sapporoensis]